MPATCARGCCAPRSTAVGTSRARGGAGHAQSFDALGVEVAQDEQDEVPWTDAQLWEAVQRLPERYRAVVHLRYVEQLPADAIAAACGISESSGPARASRVP